MKEDATVLGYGVCCNPIEHGVVKIRLKNGELRNMELLTLYQCKELFYQLPKKQIDELTVWATLIGQHQGKLRTKELIKKHLSKQKTKK